MWNRLFESWVDLWLLLWWVKLLIYWLLIVRLIIRLIIEIIVILLLWWWWVRLDWSICWGSKEIHIKATIILLDWLTLWLCLLGWLRWLLISVVGLGFI